MRLLCITLLALVCGCSSPASSDPKTCDPIGSGGLGTDFLVDVYAETGLAGVYGRRVTFADLDGDEYSDIFAIRTGVTTGLQMVFLSREGTGPGERTFVAWTTTSGILSARDGGGQTALSGNFADIDNDGDLDLFSGSYSQSPFSDEPTYVDDPNEIYLNDGTGRFTLALGSGVNTPWPLTTSASTFLDYDHDGNLDLFVGNFMRDYPNLNSYQDELYRGNGDGTFTNVTQSTVLTSEPVGDDTGLYRKPTYGATACDWNDDGWTDILTATYALGWDDLWLNGGDGSFANIAPQIGFHMDDHDHPEEADYRDGGNTFSHSCGDYDNDGDLDVFAAETTHGDDPRDEADRSRILVNRGSRNDWRVSRPDLEDTGILRSLNGSGSNGNFGNEGDHGSTWADLDNDGLLDLIIEASAYPESHAWIYHQLPDHTFENVTEVSGVRDNLVNSNGLSVDDYDRDGDLDILMGSVNTGSQSAPGGVEQLHLYENVRGNTVGNFAYVTLQGVTANRQGIGARVRVTTGCLTQTREIPGGKGSFGANDPAYAFFGLGDVELIDEIEVRWPTDPPLTETWQDVPVNRFIRITEGLLELELTEPN